MKPVEILPAALREAEEAATWYAERDPRVALAFSEELNLKARSCERTFRLVRAELRGARLQRASATAPRRRPSHSPSTLMAPAIDVLGLQVTSVRPAPSMEGSPSLGRRLAGLAEAGVIYCGI